MFFDQNDVTHFFLQAAAGSKSLFGLFGSKPAAKPKPLEARESQLPTDLSIGCVLVVAKSHGRSVVGGNFHDVHFGVS